MIEVAKDGKGNCRFVIRSLEGHALLESVSYADSGQLQQVMDHLRPWAQNPAFVERKTDHLGRFHFCLREPDGNLIGNSQFYRSEAGMENGIKNTLKRIAGPASE